MVKKEEEEQEVEQNKQQPKPEHFSFLLFACLVFSFSVDSLFVFIRAFACVCV